MDQRQYKYAHYAELKPSKLTLCPTCGGYMFKKALRCRECFYRGRSKRQSALCSDCGRFTYRGAKTCRTCLKWLDWTPELYERLKQLADTGMSASQIGAQMGLTKNTVIGKLWRVKRRFARFGKRPETTTMMRLDALNAAWEIREADWKRNCHRYYKTEVFQ